MQEGNVLTTRLNTDEVNGSYKITRDNSKNLEVRKC